MWRSGERWGKTMTSVTGSVQRYLTFYQQSFYDFWENLTPAQYGMVLLGVGAIGFFMMRSGSR